MRVIEDGMNGVAVLQIPQDHFGVVWAGSGPADEYEVGRHAARLVDRLFSRYISVTPLAFADVVDSATGDTAMLTEIGEALVERANHYGLAILNGENAILGDRITRQANVSATMIGMVPKDRAKVGLTIDAGQPVAVFDPRGKPIYLNSDGVGTKTELYERAGEEFMPLALEDSLAMKRDDSAKRAATVHVVADVVETRGSIPISALVLRAERLAGNSFAYLLHHEPMDDRLQGYAPNAPAYNISGTAVSTIDEEKLRNPPTPQPGDTLIAVTGPANPRSNGISSKRRIMTRVFGAEWHKDPRAAGLLGYLTTPSTMLYPLFHELAERNLASGYFHMSGGAFKGKLARPLAKYGLFANMEGIFPPNWQDYFFAGAQYAPAEVAYAQWPMGNDGFVTTAEPDEVIGMIRTRGHHARVVSKLEKATDGRTGIELVGVKGSNGQNVYYSGKAA